MKTQTTEQNKPITHDELNKTSSITNEYVPKYVGEGFSHKQHPLAYLSLSDLISLHGWIDSEADLIETLGGDNTDKLEQAREQMILVHQEIEKIRSMLFGGE